MLGFSMLLLGNNLLGNLNKTATSQKNLGMSFWRLTIGAGIVVIVMGVVNVVAVSPSTLSQVYLHTDINRRASSSGMPKSG